MTYNFDIEYFKDSENHNEHINEDHSHSVENSDNVDGHKLNSIEDNLHHSFDTDKHTHKAVNVNTTTKTPKYHKGHKEHDHNQIKKDLRTLEQKFEDEHTFDIEKNTWHWLQVTLVCIIKIAITLIALVLVWDCAQKDHFLLKIFYAFIAFFSPELYIIYYAIYRVFLGNKCY